MIDPIYVVMEKYDGQWTPAIGGGSSTKPYVRAFGSQKSAERSMSRLNKLRGFHEFNGERRVMKFDAEEKK